MKKIIAIILFTLLFSTFSSCGNNEITYNINDLYEIEHIDYNLYSYTITNKNGDIMLSNEQITTEPVIKVINDNILSVSVQAGTGISTCGTTYCNVNTNIVSETFMSVLGEYKNKTIYVNFDNSSNTHKIIVQDIFDKNIYYQETVLPDVQVATDPVIEWKITDDGVANITYLQGDNYTEKLISIDLK